MTEATAAGAGVTTLALVSLAGCAAGAAWWLGLVRAARVRRAAAKARRLGWRGTVFGELLDAELFPAGEPEAGDELEGRDRLSVRLGGVALFVGAPVLVAQLAGGAAVGVWWLLSAACGWWAGVLVPERRVELAAAPRAQATGWVPFGLHVVSACAALCAVVVAGASGGVSAERLASWTLLAVIGAIPVGLLVLWVAWTRRASDVGEAPAQADEVGFAGFETIPPAPQRALDALLAADPGAERDPPIADDPETWLVDATSWEEAVPWDGDEGQPEGQPDGQPDGQRGGRTVPPRAIVAGAAAQRGGAAVSGDDEAAVPWDEDDAPDGPGVGRRGPGRG
jgi:hypothetical protein